MVEEASAIKVVGSIIEVQVVRLKAAGRGKGLGGRREEWVSERNGRGGRGAGTRVASAHAQRIFIRPWRVSGGWGGWGCQPRILTSPTARQVWVGVSARLVPALHEQGEASEHETDSARMAVRIMLCSKSSVCVRLAKEAAARERAQATQRRAAPHL
jgi:hypothetical protein